MERNAFDDYVRIIRNNDMIDKIFKRICELEINGELDSDEVNSLLGIIRKYIIINTRLFRRYSVSGDNFKDFMLLIEEMNQGFDIQDYFEFFNDPNKLKLKRFISEVSVLNLINSNLSLEEIKKEEIKRRELVNNERFIKINDEEYTYDEAMELLMEMGQEAYINEIEEKLDSFLNIEDCAKEQKEINDLDYNRLCLIQNTLMKYLLNAIDEEQDIDIKNKLIRYKYNIIIICSELSNHFINNPKDFVEIESYQNKLVSLYNKYQSYFYECDSAYQTVVNGELKHLKERDTNKTDRFDDILSTIYIRTYTSLVSDPRVIKTINDYAQAAIELSDSVINKAVINASSILDKDLVFSKKVPKSYKMIKKIK